MRKIFFKYLKFLFCLMLMSSLIIPSYAAISSSDGSVFVSKSEFDSAMTDMNARLTTFEAGINSKIDSQVTSYLDSNGIWNGAHQSSLVGQSKTFTSLDDFVKSVSSKSSANKNIWTFTAEITKPGMLILDITEGLEKKSGNWRNLLQCRNNNSGWDDAMDIAVKYEQNSKVVYNSVVLTAYAHGGGSGLAIAFPEECIWETQSFVTTGEFVFSMVHNWTNSVNSNMSLETTWTPFINGGKINMEITKAVVY